MVEAFQKQFSKLDSAAAGKKFLLAVSGGLDSVVMVELFRLSGYEYGIAHCNFQLRAKESDEDEKFVKKLAVKSGVPFFSVLFDTEKFCKANKVSVQMGARQMRYEWLEEIRQKNKFDYLVTAHHADDAIETFFINLLRGTGITGLHGIKAKNGNIIRPLLPFYRKDLADFAKKNKLSWREDSSNGSDKYERNKIRHRIMPLLEELNPGAKEAITSTIENLGRAEKMLNDSLENGTGKYISREQGRIFIGYDFFKELEPAAAYLYEVIKVLGFNFEQCKQITESTSGQAGKIFLSETHRLVADRENLIIEPKTADESNTVFEIERDTGTLVTNVYSYKFSILKRKKGFKIPAGPETVALDYDNLTFPLQIRKWVHGDKFYPLGMKKPKKVSDFLIDNKIAVPDKDRVQVLISGGEIAWLAGHRPDERFKVTSATKNLYLCKSQKIVTL